MSQVRSPYARNLRRRQGQLGDVWHVDGVFIKIGGQRRYLWRAVDQDGDVLGILATRRRDARAAKRFFRKLLKRQRGTAVTAGKLCVRPPGTRPSGYPSNRAVREQQGRGAPSAHHGARTPDASFQVGSAGTVFSRGPCRNSKRIPGRVPSSEGDPSSTLSRAGLQHLEAGDER